MSGLWCERFRLRDQVSGCEGLGWEPLGRVVSVSGARITGPRLAGNEGI